jgi:N6-adenosine-specific RNA methylase IME4
VEFGTILIDPPWSYNRTTKTKATGSGKAEKLRGYADTEYQFLSTPTLAELPIGSLGSKDSVMLLCATWPFLPDAIQLLDAWDYDYVTGLTWIKTGKKLTDVAYGVGYWFRGATELVLVGKRKSAYRTNLVGLVVDDLVSERLDHSRKPDSLYEVGEHFPGPRLEVFARRQFPGWHSLGNECPNDGIDIRKRLTKLDEGTDEWINHYLKEE